MRLRKLLRHLSTVALVLFIPVLALALGTVKPWTTADEALPANADAVAEANERMHDIKMNTRARAEVEHWWGDVGTGDDDNGMHRLGSARCFMSNSAPTTLSDGMGTLDPTIPFEQQVTDLNDSASNSGGAIEDDVGHGRCWIDLDGPDDTSGNADDNTLYVYIGVAGDDNGAWTLVGGGVDVDDEVLAGSANLVYNGSFEAAGGTGDDTVGCTGCTAGAAGLPAGWDVTSGTTPTVGYTDPSGDARWGDGYHVDVTNAGAANEGIGFEMDGLPCGTTYKVIARAKDDGVATCDLDVTGEAGADFTLAATTSDVWETLSGTFTTDTCPTLDNDVIVTLTTNGADTRTCDWDHIQVYQIGDVTADRDEVGVPTMVHVTDTVTLETVLADTTPTAVTNLAISVMPPQPNCIVMVDAIVSVQLVAADEAGATCQLAEGGTAKTVSYWWVDPVSVLLDINENAHSFVLPYTVANPAPGTALDYTVECAGGLNDSAAASTNYDCTDATCTLTATMFCGGH